MRGHARGASSSARKAAFPWSALVRRASQKCNACSRARRRGTALRLRPPRAPRRLPPRQHDEIDAALLALLTGGAGIARRRGERRQDLQLFLDRRLDAGGDPERARHTRPQGQDAPAGAIPAPRRWSSPAASATPSATSGCSIAKASGDGEGEGHPAALDAARPRRRGCHGWSGTRCRPTSSGTRKATS